MKAEGPSRFQSPSRRGHPLDCRDAKGFYAVHRFQSPSRRGHPLDISVAGVNQTFHYFSPLREGDTHWTRATWRENRSGISISVPFAKGTPIGRAPAIRPARSPCSISVPFAKG